jgi:CTP:molybdopterin cytidylyltransferase MocA
MTVAAVILAASTESALADAAGRPTVRRLVEAAWAGGALPIVVVALEREGQVAAALAGSPAVLAEPAPAEAGPVGQIAHGIRVAAEQVRETEAALVWPARLAWVDPETVTSLIEAHGARAGEVLRPTWEGQAGWPALIPLEHLDGLARLAPQRMPGELLTDLEASGVPFRQVALGDPGVVIDRETPMDALPRYEGPPEPVAGPPPEWGAAAADTSEEAPLGGPSLAPYPQAADPEAASEG